MLKATIRRIIAYFKRTFGRQIIQLSEHRNTVLSSAGEPRNAVKFEVTVSGKCRPLIALTSLFLHNDKIRSEKDIFKHGQKILVYLANIPTDINRITVIATLVGPAQTFKGVTLCVTASDSKTGKPLLRFRSNPANKTTETALVVGEIYRRDSQWKFKAGGYGWETGIATAISWHR